MTSTVAVSRPGPVLRVLLVDDSEDDARLIKRTLDQARYDLVIERVDTAETMLAALERQTWDIVLSDYSMPRFDAMRALGLLRQHHPDLPFIIVSGTIGEARAVAAIKAGAQDYVAKDHLAQLVHAITQALQDAAVQRERQRAVVSLREREHLFRALIEQSHEIIAILEQDGRVRFVSQSVERLLGYQPGDLTGQTPHHVIHPDDVEMVETAFRAHAGQPGATSRFACRVRNQVGQWRVLEITSMNLSAEPAVAGIVINAHDITQHSRLEEQLAYQATHDTLTGLPNRALLLDRLAHASSLQARHGHGLAVLFLDLDEFKPVNDRFGHETGDAILAMAAERLSHCARDSDTVARLGGDEFVIVLEEIATEQEAIAVAERYWDCLIEPIRLGDTVVRLSASIGIALWTPELARPSALLRAADTAMYTAKQRGLPHVVFVPESALDALVRVYRGADA